MRLKAHPVLRLAVFCGVGCMATASLHAQIIPPEANVFGDEIVKKAPAPADGAAQPAANDENPHPGWENLLEFRSGQQLSGHIVSADKNEIVWKRPDISEPLRLRPSDIRRVYMSAEAAMGGEVNFNLNAGAWQGSKVEYDERGPTLRATLSLGGEDWLQGVVTSNDGADFNIQLNKSEAPIVVPRSQTQYIYYDIAPAMAGGFEGNLQAANRWVASAPSARVDPAGMLVIPKADESISIGDSLPTVIEIDLEIPKDAENGVHLWFDTASTSLPETAGFGAVDIEWKPNLILLRRFEKDWKNKEFPKLDSSPNDSGALDQYRVFYDSLRQDLAIFRNGQSVAEWKSERKPNNTPLRGLQSRTRYTHAFDIALEGALRANPGFVESLCLANALETLEIARRSLAVNWLILGAAQMGLDYRHPPLASVHFGRQAKEASDLGPKARLRRIELRPWNGILPKEQTEPNTEDEFSSPVSGWASGKLTHLSEKEAVVGGKSLPIASHAMIRVSGSVTPIDPVMRVGLAGGMLSASDLRIKDGAANFRTNFAHDFKLSTDSVKFLVFDASPPRPDEHADMLVFKNGDALPGALVSLKPGVDVRWKLATGQELALPFSKLAGIRFDPASRAKPEMDKTSVTLRNGDRLRGTLLSFDRNGLGWNEPLLGKLSIGRPDLWKLMPSPAAATRDGAEDPEDWIASEVDSSGSPRPRENTPAESRKLQGLYFDGCYLDRTQNLSLSAILPHQENGFFEARAEVSGTNGGMPGCGISVVGKETADRSPQINIVYDAEGGVEVTTEQGENRKPSGASARLKQDSNRLSVRAFVNSTAGTVDLMINGVLAASVGKQETDRSPGINYGVEFSGMASDEGPAMLSNLWVGPWNGELPATDSPRPASTAFANGDSSAVIPSELKDGSYVLETEVGPAQVPAQTVTVIAFGGKMEHHHPAARLRLTDGSAVHAASFQIEAGAIHCHSELFGDLQLPLASVAEVVFDPAPLRDPDSVEMPKLGVGK